MKLRHRPIALREANSFVGIEHRHNGPVRGYKWALGAYFGEKLDQSEPHRRLRWELLPGVAA